MKYYLEFYADYSSLLNNYKKINDDIFNELVNQYKVDNCPADYIINLRQRNYFEHKIEKMKIDYQKQLPYYIDNYKELYKTSSKINIKKLAKNTTMYEKDLCKEIWFASYDGIKYPFDIVDIQTPLKSKRSDKYGEIDVLGVNIKDNDVVIYLIEVKPISTTETLLRAVIESITYRYIIEANKDKFITDFKKYMKKYEGKGSKALEIRDKLLNEEKLNFTIKSLILVPDYLYEHVYAKKIYNEYKEKIDFYTVSYTESDIEYTKKEDRKPTLFKKGCYPKIEKYNE